MLDERAQPKEKSPVDAVLETLDQRKRKIEAAENRVADNQEMLDQACKDLKELVEAKPDDIMIVVKNPNSETWAATIELSGMPAQLLQQVTTFLLTQEVAHIKRARDESVKDAEGRT